MFGLEGSLNEALRWQTLAVEIEPDNPRLWAELAELHLRCDEPGECVECRRRILELGPADRVGALINLGWALQEDGRPYEAIEQYLIARDIRPGSAPVHFVLGGAYEEQGRMAEAESELREAIRSQPRFPIAYSRLATLLRKNLPDDDFHFRLQPPHAFSSAAPCIVTQVPGRCHA